MTFSLNHNFNMIYKSLIKTVKNQKAGKLNSGKKFYKILNFSGKFTSYHWQQILFVAFLDKLLQEYVYKIPKSE